MNTIEQLANLNFQFPITHKVLWGEMDAFAHVNNVTYFRYFETGRIQFFDQSKLWQLFLAEQVRIVVVKLECNFVEEIVHPDEIEIAVAIKKVGNSSLTVHHVVKSLRKNKLCAHGEGIIVATNPNTNHSMPWPENIRTELHKYI